MAQCYLVVLLTLALTSALLYQVSATLADPSDVTFLKNLYRELNYPQQLIGWNSGGGDPWEVSWKGITCNGSSVMFIQINGVEISGRLGDQLFNLFHLAQVNISHDSLSGDLSNDNFTGDLPTSFQYLKNLTTLQMDELNLFGRPKDQLFNLKMDLTTSEHQQQPVEHQQQLQDGGDDKAEKQQVNGDEQQGGDGGDGDVQGGDGHDDDEPQGGEGGDSNQQRGEEGDDEQGEEEGDDDEQEGEEEDDDEQEGEEEDDDGRGRRKTTMRGKGETTMLSPFNRVKKMETDDLKRIGIIIAGARQNGPRSMQIVEECNAGSAKSSTAKSNTVFVRKVFSKIER